MLSHEHLCSDVKMDGRFALFLTMSCGGAIRARLAFFFALLALSACSGREPRLLVGRILVDGTLGSGADDVSREGLRASLRSSLDTTKCLRFDETAGQAFVRARAVIERVPPTPDGVQTVVLQLTLDPRATGGQSGAIDATVEMQADSVAEQAQLLVDKAVRRGMESLDRQARLTYLATPQVVAELKSADPELKRRAVAILAQRRDHTTLDALVEVLDDNDTSLALQAVGALVALGDPRAVIVLTDLTHRKSPTFVRQIVFAVGAIGGREAEAYLFTVASGHSDPAVQQAAKQALQELQQRSRAAAAANQEAQ
jgi:hypothetical protein